MVRLSTLSSRLKAGGSGSGSSTPSRTASPRPQAPPTSDPRERTAMLTLKTNVIKARNVAAADRSGTSDPYLVVTLGDAKEATQAISKTLNPEWNVCFDLPIVGVQSLLLECVCWDKDRFGKDYLGEFDVPLEDIFGNGQTTQEPKWYALKSKRKNGKKGSKISGEVQLQFSILDPTNPSATSEQIFHKFLGLVASSPGLDDDIDENTILAEQDDEAGADKDKDEESSEETDDAAKPEAVEKKRKRQRLARLRRKTKARAYEFSGGSDVLGILFLEVSKIQDLPPERNVTRTSFDMDPFVVISLGRKTFRTRVVRHDLNPVYDEKLIFQVLPGEKNYSMNFTVVDRDKLSSNDYVGTVNFPLQNIISCSPEADPATGLYHLREPVESGTSTVASYTSGRSRFRLPLSRSSSGTSLSKMSRPVLRSHSSQGTPPTSSQLDIPHAPTSVPETSCLSPPSSSAIDESAPAPSLPSDDPDLKSFELPISLKNKDKWEDKHNPTLYIKAKYLPYPALRQQFWRALLKQYDADDSNNISKVELTTMLDTLGSTLKESTIDGFFKRFASEYTPQNPSEIELTFDQVIICLEDQLEKASQRRSMQDAVKAYAASLQHSLSLGSTDETSESDTQPSSWSATPSNAATPMNNQSQTSIVPAISVDEMGNPGEMGDALEKDDLADEVGEEHVVEIRECPICHQPRLNKRSDSDIIMHIATCASQDWRQVNNFVMGGFVTSSQAQRKWYSKVITKISYGGYKLGANSANILVQDRITGQINEERMSVYVRLGIRLLYKGLKSRDMEKKRIRKLLKSLSIKQGRKFDDPASASEIESFINFHQLDMSEVLRPTEEFKTFNEFFYRQLKPDARPCSAPDNPKIIVSPADCRSVVFNKVDDATKIWVKGREFSIERLLGNAYPEDAKRYKNGALGIFRLAPQDYHRFHIPVDGVLGEPKLIEGEYYTVNPMAIRSALDVYGENVRVIVPINSTTHGRVMVICVGAMMVGSTVITRKPGEEVHRAEELGYFKFGGSTLVVLFEPGVMKFDNDLIENSSGALETLIRVGMSIGHSPEQSAHTPDMRKENVSAEEKQEAQRRIAGSVGPAPSPPDAAI
ncbi:hypothetical protein L228DRAFT_250698 [Xylona heveae TC161]|uniref:Phosphatidylserine decarboxylase proenzyme 2 n=1 Tax=Xylona heveae (strain CBS 132557 / TC161) TaxID=1328760 RepID=A0A164ZX26_XYLHT|nr:hypothetical protein L228DRAFT_250698 [Xylona heveae TC161]KZF19644.1 hypothetical protein L228DRAFT_250698 [Xylona heveae TC161]